MKRKMAAKFFESQTSMQVMQQDGINLEWKVQRGADKWDPPEGFKSSTINGETVAGSNDNGPTTEKWYFDEEGWGVLDATGLNKEGGEQNTITRHGLTDANTFQKQVFAKVGGTPMIRTYEREGAQLSEIPRVSADAVVKAPAAKKTVVSSPRASPRKTRSWS